MIGAGSGYGAGIAKTFAQQGAKVIVADINENGGKQTVDAVPDNMKFHHTNVAKEKDWKLLVEATQDAFGSIDCLVNNAGTTYKNKASWKQYRDPSGPDAVGLTGFCSRLSMSLNPNSTGASMSMSKESISGLQPFFLT